MRIAIPANSFCQSEELKDYARTALSRHVIVMGDVKPLLRGEALTSFLADADGALIGHELIDDALLSACPRLRVVAKYGVGLDNIDFAACARKNVTVLWRAGVNAEAVAEHTVGLMIATLRRIALADRHLHQGSWVREGGHQLSRRTVAVIGCGHVGSRVAKLLKAFHCDILLRDIVDKSELATELGAKLVSFSGAVREADVVTAHVPLTVDTQEMFNAAVFQSMKAGSYFFNASRGEVVDECALIAALTHGPLAGAGLDVFQEEPMREFARFNLPNLVMTPHTAANCREAVIAMGQAAVDDLSNFFS